MATPQHTIPQSTLRQFPVSKMHLETLEKFCSGLHETIQKAKEANDSLMVATFIDLYDVASKRHAAMTKRAGAQNLAKIRKEHQNIRNNSSVAPEVNGIPPKTSVTPGSNLVTH